MAVLPGGMCPDKLGLMPGMEAAFWNFLLVYWNTLPHRNIGLERYGLAVATASTSDLMVALAMAKGVEPIGCPLSGKDVWDIEAITPAVDGPHQMQVMSVFRT